MRDFFQAMKPYAPRHPGGGCWTCTHWRGEFICGGAHIVCHYWPDRESVIQGMDQGCAFWEREPGGDDEIVYQIERVARGWFQIEFSAPGLAKSRKRRSG